MHGRNRASAVVAGISGFGAGLLPLGLCPACWPAIAGILSSVGLGFLLEQSLFPIAAGLLLVSVASLSYRARRRRGYGPLALGSLAAFGVLAGRFWLGSDAISYASVVGLLTAAVWNGWPRAVPEDDACGSCECAPAAD